MDYPISVPSVGLVGGKFVDEDPLAGTPGSLIPAQWGNAVTDEIIHVITGAGLTPDELNNTQLLAAIKAVVTQSGVSPGRLIGVRVFNTAGAFTYNPTAGTNSVVVEVQGGGGAGGGAAATTAGAMSIGTGGTAGAYGISRLTSGFSGQTVTVGIAGVPVSGTNGGAGGTSSFGSLIIAPGGSGGQRFGPTTPGGAGGGGAAGAPASGGNIRNAAGGPGGICISVSATIQFGGIGANSFYGGGGTTNTTGVAPGAAVSPGSGGGGASQGASAGALPGGAGGAGIVIIWEYA